MGQKVASGVESKVQSGKEALGGLESKVQKTSAYDPYSAIKKAMGGTIGEPESTQYKSMKQTGGYTGAKDISGLDGYGDAQKKIGAATTAAGQTGTESGQQQLLKETFARPNYSQGATKLDQVLLRQSAGGKQALQDLSSKYQTLGSQFGTAQEDIAKNIAQSQEQAAKNKAAFIPAEQKTMSELMTPIEQRAEQANIENPALQSRVQQDLMDTALNQETLKQLGLDVGQRLYDLDLNNYLNLNQTQQTVDTVASEQERQKYAALNQLFDGGMNQLSAVNPLKNYQAVGFNREQFLKDQAEKQAEFENIMRNTNLSSEYMKDYAYENANVNAYDMLQGAPVAYQSEWKGTNPSFDNQDLFKQIYKSSFDQSRAVNEQNIQRQYQDLLNQLKYNRTIGMES
jgi:hypothetical protein